MSFPQFRAYSKLQGYTNIVCCKKLCVVTSIRFLIYKTLPCEQSFRYTLFNCSWRNHTSGIYAFVIRSLLCLTNIANYNPARACDTNRLRRLNRSGAQRRVGNIYIYKIFHFAFRIPYFGGYMFENLREKKAEKQIINWYRSEKHPIVFSKWNLSFCGWRYVGRYPSNAKWNVLYVHTFIGSIDSEPHAGAARRKQGYDDNGERKQISGLTELSCWQANPGSLLVGGKEWGSRAYRL